MGSSPDSSSAPSNEFLAVFSDQADANGTMPLARFMALALYHPEVGYYQRARVRVGRGGETDFFAATSRGEVFGELVNAACAKILRASGRDPAQHVFIEIGAEPARGGVMTNVAHAFARTEVRRLNAPLALHGPCVVFSNELFDAQPCQSLVYREGRWRTLGVKLSGGRLTEVELAAPASTDAPPSTANYRLDEPRAATVLAEKILAEPWQGLFVAIDYGKTLQSLWHDTPQGTLRAYYRHTQSNDLLARPGEQDLTCHVCWDWLEAALRERGFAAPVLEFQEAFFIRHAGEVIAKASAAEAAHFSPRKRALLQLLHPAHLGQKFQVLHAVK